ncbi:MAG: CPBP family intramembrane metalloprotease [Planctomycetaceae bacterium]|nr:CPBP family intramembrane metalloprotease [Planctomycetaceae bacterium]
MPDEQRSLYAAKSADVAPDYWELTRQPLPSALFLLPLLLVYELGVIWFAHAGELTVRNGADHWIREGLLSVGFQQVHLLPTLVLLALGAWHLIGKYPHKVSGELMTGMLAESVLFAVLLVVIGQTQDLLFHQWSIPDPLSFLPERAGATAISYIGAGIYEEVLFRGMLCTLIYAGGRSLKIPVSACLIFAMISSSVLFSYAHYIGPAADQYSHFSFLFRACAGMYFAGLYFCRGLGIAIGAHTAYDLLVGLLLPAMM